MPRFSRNPSSSTRTIDARLDEMRPSPTEAVAVALLYASVEDPGLSVAVKVFFAAQAAQRFVLISNTYTPSDFNLQSLSMMTKLVSVCLLLFSAERGLQQVRCMSTHNRPYAGRAHRRREPTISRRRILMGTD